MTVSSRYQPHPFSSAPSRAWWVVAELVAATGVPLAIALEVRWLLLTVDVPPEEVSNYRLLGLVVMTLVVTALAYSWLRREAWMRTPGAEGVRRWDPSIPRHPARLIPEGARFPILLLTAAVIARTPHEWAGGCALGVVVAAAVALTLMPARQARADLPRFALRVVAVTLAAVAVSVGLWSEVINPAGTVMAGVLVGVAGALPFVLVRSA